MSSFLAPSVPRDISLVAVVLLLSQTITDLVVKRTHLCYRTDLHVGSSKLVLQAKIDVSAGLLPSGVSRGESFLVFQLLEATCIPWLAALQRMKSLSP